MNIYQIASILLGLLKGEKARRTRLSTSAYVTHQQIRKCPPDIRTEVDEIY
jgi:hypothetical protein